MNNTYCNAIQKGIFVSHRGQSLCCTNTDKHLDMSPKEFWNSEVRKKALENMKQNKPVKGCEKCYYNEKNKIPSERNTYNTFNHIPTKKLPTVLDVDFSNFCNLSSSLVLIQINAVLDLISNSKFLHQEFII